MSDKKTSDGLAQKLGSFNRRVSSSVLWALLFAALIGVWALTGEIKGGSRSDGATKAVEQSQDVSSSPQKATLFQVRTFVFPSRRYASELIIRGRTFSDNQVEVRAETAGKVIKLPVHKGDFVKKGALLCQLEDGARYSAVVEAEALLAQSKADYNASQKLERRGHTAGLKVLQNKATYDRAAASLERAKLDLTRTKITAPFNGYVEKLPAKVGSLLAVGEPCGTLVGLDPLHVVGAVKEVDVQKIKAGMKATVHLVTGEVTEGIVRFLSATAEEETRTFRVEVEIANPKGALKSGVTTDIKIKLPAEQALLLPPSLLTLSDLGQVGVRVVNEQSRVEFMAVDILSEQTEGIWVKALPPRTAVITVGQDFVKAGQSVRPTLDTQFKDKPGS